RRLTPRVGERRQRVERAVDVRRAVYENEISRTTHGGPRVYACSSAQRGVEPDSSSRSVRSAGRSWDSSGGGEVGSDSRGSDEGRVITSPEGSGRYSGPVWPHAASSVAQARAGGSAVRSGFMRTSAAGRGA